VLEVGGGGRPVSPPRDAERERERGREREREREKERKRGDGREKSLGTKDGRDDGYRA